MFVRKLGRSAGVVCASLALLLLAPSANADGDIERGKQLANMCIGCHNIPGYSITFPTVYKIPRINGQSADYIKYALQEYAAGNRYPTEFGKVATMPAIAASLSEQDMDDLAAYYSNR